jgi:hypothetical protein
VQPDVAFFHLNNDISTPPKPATNPPPLVSLGPASVPLQYVALLVQRTSQTAAAGMDAEAETANKQPKNKSNKKRFIVPPLLSRSQS